jgi:hypothetical protein
VNEEALAHWGADVPKEKLNELKHYLFYKKELNQLSGLIRVQDSFKLLTAI